MVQSDLAFNKKNCEGPGEKKSNCPDSDSNRGLSNTYGTFHPIGDEAQLDLACYHYTIQAFICWKLRALFCFIWCPGRDGIPAVSYIHCKSRWNEGRGLPSYELYPRLGTQERMIPTTTFMPKNPLTNVSGMKKVITSRSNRSPHSTLVSPHWTNPRLLTLELAAWMRDALCSNLLSLIYVLVS